MDGIEDSLHVQHLRKIAAVLKEAHQQSDSVTWVPETVPQHVQNAVRKALEATNNVQDTPASAHQPGSPAPGHQQTLLPTADPSRIIFEGCKHHATGFSASQAALHVGLPADVPGIADQVGIVPDTSEAVAGPVVIKGSQYIRAEATSKSSNTSWVVTTCVVPEGLPTAAAADVGGGLACLEVVCRVLNLQDCVPAAATPSITKALAKVNWQEFGLSYKEFAPSTTDTTGILTLDVQPHAVVTPLAMVVCSINTISSCSDPIWAAAAAANIVTTEAAAEDNRETTTTQAPTAPSSRKRKKNGNSKPTTLSCKRETALYIAALENALLALKASLPAGYLQGKLEACVASCLPPISASLTSIITQAANPVICKQACKLLSCDSEQLQQTLLLKLQTAASEALAAKSSVGSSARQLENQRRQRDAGAGRRSTTVAAAAAAVADAAGDGMGRDGRMEADSHVGQQEPGQLHFWGQQQWQQAGTQQSAPLLDAREGSLQQQHEQLVQVPNSTMQAINAKQQPDWLCIEQPALPTSAAMRAGGLDWLGEAGFNGIHTAGGTGPNQGVGLWQSVAAEDDGWHCRPRQQQTDNLLIQPALQQQQLRQPQRPQSKGCQPADGFLVQKPAGIKRHREEMLGVGAPGNQPENYSMLVDTDIAHADTALEQSATVAASALFGSLFPDQSLATFAAGGSKCANLVCVSAGADAAAAAAAVALGCDTGNLVTSQTGWRVKHCAQPPRRRVSGSAAASLF